MDANSACFVVCLCLLFLIVSIIFAVYAGKQLNHIKNLQEVQEKRNEVLKEERARLQKEIDNIKDKTDEHLSIIWDEYQKEQEKIKRDFELFKKKINSAREAYITTIEDSYDNAESQYDELIKNYGVEIDDAKDELQKIKDTINAGVQAALREQEKEEKLDFYRLKLTSADEEDIIKLNSLKLSLHQPVVLSKLIWSQYFMKQTKELCNRVFGTETICGIYKITNLKTKQVYVGQSVNISDRIKSHIKCGLGIDISASNKLYQNMIEFGVWNFTFELLEECSRAELDEKEKKWIEIYQSNIYGLNTLKGNG